MNTSFFLVIGSCFVIVSTWYFIFNKSEAIKRKNFFTIVDHDKIYKGISPIKKQLAKNFYVRCKIAKKNAYVLLILVITILLFGAYIFYNASSIVNTETKSLIGTQDWLRTKDSITQKYCYVDANIKGIPMDTLTRGGLARLKMKIGKDYKKNIEDETVLSLQLKNQAYVQDSSIINVIASMLIRIMISFIVFYLVQIFLRLYRYNLQVSDFYLNKLDAILSYEDMKLNFEDTIKFFSHSFDVGNGPKNPVDTAIEIIKAAKDIK